MVREIVHDPMFLGQKSIDATEESCLSLLGGWTAQIIQHEADHCNGVLI